MTPNDYYDQKCREGIIIDDPNQRNALQVLQRVYVDLINEANRRTSFLSFLAKPHTVKGAYLWGGVGIGKTFLMDCFYHTLPFGQKKRMHFHEFMQHTHQELTKQQGVKDPLKSIAAGWAKQVLVLCFDEFYVSDITDAMLLGRLIRLLFERGVTLVMTSNIEPKELYKNGLQRQQFIPAIQALEAETEVTYLASAQDYRLRHLKTAGVFYTPLGPIAEQNMTKSFDDLTRGEKIEHTPIILFGRSIPVVKRSANVIWFTFPTICSVPRSQNDYLAMVKQYSTVFISDIPVIAASEKDKICLFITLVDVVYDARVRLVMSAAEPVENLYLRGYHILEYTRTHSRLLEMQSREYFTGEND